MTGLSASALALTRDSGKTALSVSNFPMRWKEPATKILDPLILLLSVSFKIPVY